MATSGDIHPSLFRFYHGLGNRSPLRLPVPASINAFIAGVILYFGVTVALVNDVVVRPSFFLASVSVFTTAKGAAKVSRR